MATHAPVRSPARHPDRGFFLGFVIVAWLGVLLGFVPPVNQRLAGAADYPAPLVLHLHAASFSAWMMLLAAQVLLIRTGGVALHRRIGTVMAGLIPVMVLSGFFSEVYSQRFYLAHPPDSQAFFVLPIFYVLAFGALAAAAVAQRRRAAVHKRLIYLATAVIAGAAWTRFTGPPLTRLLGDGYWGMIGNVFTPANLLLLALAAHDLRSRGSLHRATLIGGAAILAGELVVSFVYHAPGWLPIARMIVEPLPGPPL